MVIPTLKEVIWKENRNGRHVLSGVIIHSIIFYQSLHRQPGMKPSSYETFVIELKECLNESFVFCLDAVLF